MPYIYSAAWRVTKNGETLMRSLSLEFSSDKLAGQISDQFMFGEALLISPVTKEGAKERTLYLPAGQDWIDFWTGKRVRGGQSINAEAPLNRIPIYARAGSIIPFGPHAESTSAKPNPIELRIYTGASAKFTLYEDEGDSYDYERGAYSEIPIHWDDRAGRLTIGNRRGRFPGMLDRRTFRVVVVRDERGTGVASSSEPDATIDYAGKTTSVNVRFRP
jgi:alpha-D-xyloside xylohydrolase